MEYQQAPSPRQLFDNRPRSFLVPPKWGPDGGHPPTPTSNVGWSSSKCQCLMTCYGIRQVEFNTCPRAALLRYDLTIRQPMSNKCSKVVAVVSCVRKLKSTQDQALRVATLLVPCIGFLHTMVYRICRAPGPGRYFLSLSYLLLLFGCPRAGGGDTNISYTANQRKM